MKIFDIENKIDSRIIRPLNNDCINYVGYYGTFGCRKSPHPRSETRTAWIIANMTYPDTIPVSFLRFTDAWWDVHFICYLEGKLYKMYTIENYFVTSKILFFYKDKFIQELQRVLPEFIAEAC